MSSDGKRYRQSRKKPPLNDEELAYLRRLVGVTEDQIGAQPSTKKRR